MNNEKKKKKRKEIRALVNTYSVSRTENEKKTSKSDAAPTVAAKTDPVRWRTRRERAPVCVVILTRGPAATKHGCSVEYCVR